MLSSAQIVAQAKIAAPDGHVVSDAWENDVAVVVMFERADGEVSFESGPMIVDRESGSVSYLPTAIDPASSIEGMIPVNLT